MQHAVDAFAVMPCRACRANVTSSVNRSAEIQVSKLQAPDFETCNWRQLETVVRHIRSAILAVRFTRSDRLQERNFHIGIVQMSCTPEPEQNLERAHRARPRRLPPRARRSSACPSFSRRSISASAKTSRCSTWPKPIPGPATKRLGDVARELKVTIIASLFERRARRHLSQHRGHARHGRQARGHLSQDAHPRRSALLREVLFHAGRSRLQVFRNRLRRSSARWSAGTSGIPRARV